MPWPSLGNSDSGMYFFRNLLITTKSVKFVLHRRATGTSLVSSIPGILGDATRIADSREISVINDINLKSFDNLRFRTYVKLLSSKSHPIRTWQPPLWMYTNVLQRPIL